MAQESALSAFAGLARDRRSPGQHTSPRALLGPRSWLRLPVVLMLALGLAGIAAAAPAEAPLSGDLLQPRTGAAEKGSPGESGHHPEPALLARGMADTFDVAPHVSNVTMTLKVSGIEVKIPYYSNRTLGTTYTDVTRAILVCHGTLRNADEYESAVEEAGAMAGGADAATFIITPQFLAEQDIDTHHLSDDYAFWAYYGWRKGDNSINTVHNPRNFALSSFTVLDTVLYRIITHLPNLQQIVTSSGERLPCELIDIALGGAALKSSYRPEIGELVRFGECTARVMRHCTDGFVVEFSPVNNAGTPVTLLRTDQLSQL